MTNIPNGTQVIHHISFLNHVYYKEENGVLKVWSKGEWVEALIPSINKMIDDGFELEILQSWSCTSSEEVLVYSLKAIMPPLSSGDFNIKRKVCSNSYSFYLAFMVWLRLVLMLKKNAMMALKKWCSNQSKTSIN